ncbi:MAG: hypothetical protein IJR35_00465 [Synergistaceae bacterium]|nr:hypothetical protein [Synergistaceae bacterium]
MLIIPLLEPLPPPIAAAPVLPDAEAVILPPVILMKSTLEPSLPLLPIPAPVPVLLDVILPPLIVILTCEVPPIPAVELIVPPLIVMSPVVPPIPLAVREPSSLPVPSELLIVSVPVEPLISSPA